MKRLSIVALFALILSSTAFANKTTGPDFKGRENFNHSFPQATGVEYKLVENFIEVNFTWHNMQLQAFYDLEGNMIGTSRKIAIKDLPLSYMLGIKRDFPGMEPVEAIEFDDSNAGLNYYITVAGPKKTYVLRISNDGTIDVFKKMKN